MNESLSDIVVEFRVSSESLEAESIVELASSDDDSYG